MIQDDECPIKGVINKIDDNKVIVSKLTEYGEDDGEAILKKENIEFEILQVGSQNIHGCMGCNMCFRNKNEKCVITTDSFNELLQKIKDVDGIILGSPVHFSGIAGTMKCFLDRACDRHGAY